MRHIRRHPPAAFSEARSLLVQLGVLDRSGGFTRHGAVMAGLALQPRLSLMVMKASELGDPTTVCEIAALLWERDLFRRTRGVPEADIRTRLDLLRGTAQLTLHMLSLAGSPVQVTRDLAGFGRTTYFEVRTAEPTGRARWKE